MNPPESKVAIPVSQEFIRRLQAKARINPSIPLEQIAEAYLWYGLINHDKALELETTFQNSTKSVMIETLLDKLSLRRK